MNAFCRVLARKLRDNIISVENFNLPMIGFLLELLACRYIPNAVLNDEVIAMKFINDYLDLRLATSTHSYALAHALCKVVS